MSWGSVIDADSSFSEILEKKLHVEVVSGDIGPKLLGQQTQTVITRQEGRTAQGLSVTRRKLSEPSRGLYVYLRISIPLNESAGAGQRIREGMSIIG